MNEYIEIHLRRNGRSLRINRQVPRGIELAEPDPIERAVQIGFAPANAVAEYRLQRVRQLQGWQPNEFALDRRIEDGTITLRGVDKFSLPEGRYIITLNIEEAACRTVGRTVLVPHDGFGAVEVAIELDDREIVADLADCDPAVSGVLERSTIDDEAAIEWIEDAEKRPARRACLLNLLASLRARPAKTKHLLAHVRNIFHVERDRAYAQVDAAMFDRLQQLAMDDRKPFYREGYPKSDTHLRLLEHLPEPAARKALFPRESLVSFRGEGKPSLQAVIFTPPAGVDYTYADLDLDLGNPLQDAVGLFVHFGELASRKTTDHLDLRKQLAKGAAKEFLYYIIK
jgi:hypothetical protein